MAIFQSEEQYIGELKRRSGLPQGFSVATTTLDFVSREREQELTMNLALLLLDQPSDRFAGVFTSNRFCGGPIVIGRRRIREKQLRAVLINNRVANVGAPGGVEDARKLCDTLGGLIGEAGERIMPASTGIIGWRLPVAEMTAALPKLIDGLRKDSALPVARAIMTTDSYPKLHREDLGQGSIVGVAKGAGMIEPHMGTLLVFLLTDLSMDRNELDRCLRSCVESTFNRISVDGDQSTSDMALLFSSGRKPAVSEDSFREALEMVCSRLAEDVVRNGEGVGHVIRICLQGAPDPNTAAAAAKAVVNSPLVKTAVFGNDPNVGRIVSALGDFADAARFHLDLNRLRVSMGGVEIFAGGCFLLDTEKEARLNSYLKESALDALKKGFPEHDRQVLLEVDLGAGDARAEVLGADLSYQYVKENADYRS
ncbi:MAG: bifunctional glutamate N-acetyltransferase/amino-acid acetyltransferase ArgJ [Spirochaetaceae bacterium]|nr:MAG: bifunctional glutamate N-acetyltransferase/amino-acid acetyltransferase ArgJ [Spirochaetaceae bacterium]